MQAGMEGLTQNEKIIWSHWGAKSPREVVREAATKGTLIALAIKYLMDRNSWTEETAKDWFNAEVKAWTVQLLTSKQIFKVLHILNKAQLNVEDHLMTLAEEAISIEYRDFIIEQLDKIATSMKSENLSKYEDFKSHAILLRFLEKSFEIDGTFKQNKAFGTGKDKIIVTETEIKALTIKKIREYPKEWKKKIATILFFDCFEFVLLEFSSPEKVWEYLLQHNKAMVLVRWINMQLSEVVRDMNARYNFFNNEGFAKKLLHVDTKGLDAVIISNLDATFRKWPITNEMIKKVGESHCFAYTKMCIYDTLCSYGIVNEDERNNLYAIVSRLARTQNLRLIDDVFSETCSTMTKRDFYLELSKYCVKNKLFKVLSMCVDGDVLGDDLSDVEDDVRECLELWLSFKRIEYTADRQSHVMPVYKTCEQIARDNIDDFISSNPYLVLGIILLEDNAKLFNIFSNEDVLEFKDFKLPNRGYKEKLSHLYEVYKKFYNIDKQSASMDVNVYQLLSDYRGLDVFKVFEFQIVNQHINKSSDKPERRSLGSLLASNVDLHTGNIQGNQSVSVEMPHFANEKLMKRYGYVAKLNHLYYIKQCRPCKASQAFVAQQYQLYNRLQDKGIKNACCEVHALALQHWNEPAVTTSAISFAAMIGCNPARNRVHMTIANMMVHYMKTVHKMTDDAVTKAVSDYMSKLLLGNEQASKEILQYLEEITLWKLERTLNDNRLVDMAVVLYESQTMVKFAMLHNLMLPEKVLKRFSLTNSWFNFLLFADVFRYPLHQMIQLTQEFNNKCYGEHMKHVMMYRNIDDSLEKEFKSNTGSGQRRMSRLNSVEPSPTQLSTFEFPEASSGSTLSRELWEVAAACHGPEDPTAALIRAAASHQEPLLPLLATCYEPNAVGILWAYWIIASLGDAVSLEVKSGLQWDISQQHPSDMEFQCVTELCLAAGYVRTLHESMIIFFPESPLRMLTAFLCQCVWQRSFGPETSKYLYSFSQHCQRKYSADSALPWLLPKKSLQIIAVSLVKIALSQCFDSAYHQKEFLKCLVDAQFGFDFMTPAPDFEMIYQILEISMQTPSAILVAKVLQDDYRQYLTECVKSYTNNKDYEVALKIAKLASLPVNNILIAEWSHKHYLMLVKENVILQDKDWTLYIAQCSEAFKQALVTFDEAVTFLTHYAKDVKDNVQKYYCCKIILSWFDDHLQFGQRREEIEHAMWDAYFQSEASDCIFIHNHQSTLHFILSGQKDENASRTIAINADKPFSKLMTEIDIESDIRNITSVVTLQDDNSIELCRKALNQLLELKLTTDAYRLSALYKVPVEYKYKPPACPVQIVTTCLKLAERTLSPYELPQELRLVISSPSLQHKLSLSETSDASFEELVVIQEKLDNVPENTIHVAAREDADRLSALEALAARSGLLVAKQVANYFRISLQIGWNYASILKYQNNPIDLISYVSGRARMPLANLVFRTFNMSSKEIAEFLCHEMVSAIISPHLVKTSSFRQKEHFQYTLWGYVLNSDIEMFLNMRPDACTQIGRLMLDHLMAFRKIYKCTMTSQIEPDALDDSYLDIETLIDEEYQTVDEFEVESLAKSSTKSSTDGATVASTETESVFSVSTVYSLGNKTTRESRRNLFDIISKSNVHIRYEVKSNVRKITKGAKLSTKQVNIISIELLVLAHECFSSACDTEGVAVILRSAAALTSRLLAAKSWRLMVRLLTGLARYADMPYIFKALRDNHQFEFLLGQFDYMLGQHQDKITEFKQGLLDFLKHHCPGDTDTYIMVALHFNMYAEAANVKKQQALGLITDLEKLARDSQTPAKKPSKSIEWLLIHDSASTRSILETALNHCTDASELFLQGGCMGFAGEMADLAQQIALQISLLNASPTRLILNRSADQVYRLVSEYLSFMEGLILMVGRGGGAGAQWRELSYRRALTNDQAYLRDMALYRPDVALDIINRYKTEKKTTSISQSAIKELRTLCR